MVGSSGMGEFLGGPPNFGQGAPGRIRGQATALKHQGPRNREEPQGLGTTTARGLYLGGSIFQQWQRVLRLSPGREGSQAIRLPGHGRISGHLPGLRRAWWMVGAAGRVSHLVAPLKFGQGAPGRICGQAIAQTHQGPLNLGERWALALPPRGGNRRGSIFR